MISQYHSERKSWVLKALSLFVIFTFLATQSDLQLAFANVPVMNPVAVAAQSAADASKTDKIHFMQNLTDQQNTLQGQASDNPLKEVSPDQSQTKNPFTGSIPQAKTPDLSTTFLNGISPIVGAESKTVQLTTKDPTNPDVVTVTYQDGTSFTYNSNPSSNKILAISDFTKPRIGSDGQQVKDAKGNLVYDLETRRFDWGGVDSATGTPYVRIVTEGANGALSTYQKFTLSPVQADGSGGELGNMMESGYLVQDPATGKDVEILSVRDDGTRVTVCEPGIDASYYIEKTYEKLPEGENRLLSYRKITTVDGQVLATVDLDINYDTGRGLVTVVDRSVSGTTPPASVSFWEYKLIGQNVRGELLAVGEMDRTSGQVISRMDITTTTYTITYPQTPDQKLVFERLPNGGFGRILRYRLGDIDLEYRYETVPATETSVAQETITVLDYRAGTFLKMGFLPGASPSDASGLIDSPQNVIAAGTFVMAGTTPTYKNVLTRVGDTWVVADPNDSRIFDVYEAFPNGSWGGIIRSRGPPETGSEVFVDIRYSYDVANQRVTAYDVTNERYALYDWKDPKTPRLLEQGEIAVDAQGNVLSQTVTKTYNAEILGPVSVPSAEYETDIAFASAVSALQVVPGVTASGIERVNILTDPNAPSRLTVVLRYENTEYFYLFDTASSSSVLAKIRIPMTAGGYRVVEYDAEGRQISESQEAVDGTLTVLTTYRYETAGEVIVIDQKAHTFRILVYNADKTMGLTLRSGFYNDAEKIYSIQNPGETESKWFTYGADEMMLTKDDAASTRPSRGPTPGQSLMGRRSLGGSENPELDRKIQELRSMMKDYEGCTEENMRSDWHLSQKCEDLVTSAGALQKDIENEQYRTEGGIGARGANGGGGIIDLNYHSPAPTPDYVAALVGLGSAPIDVSWAQVTYTNDAKTEASISLNGLVEVWQAGAEGWAKGNDVLVQVTETANNTTWRYTDGRVTSVVDGAGTELASYDYAVTGRVTVTEASGARYEYSYTDQKDPFGSGELVNAKFEQNGVWVTQGYERGRLSSMCDGNGGNCTTYQYNEALNQATLTSAAGTRVIALGGDGKLGTVDDYLVGGTDTGLAIQRDANNRISQIVDQTYGIVTNFTYDTANRVQAATSWANGNVINEIRLDLGADGALGTADDRLLYMSGIQNGHIFAETFDAATGRVTSVDGYFEVVRQDEAGRYLRSDGTIAMTEQEAAKDVVHQWVSYTWTSAPAKDVSKFPLDQQKDALDWSLVVATYTVTGPNRSLQEKRGYTLGVDGLFGTSDDHLTSVEAYDPVNKVRFEMNYDDQGRVTLYRNLASGDTLRYTYDDTAKKVTITSSENYFKQIYQFDEAHPGDFQYARLVEEERDGISRKWDESEQQISTTNEMGVETKTPSGHKVTSVTDKDGITTFYQDGVILSVVRKDGTVLRTYTHIVDPATGELVDVGFDGKDTLPKVTICLSGETSGCSDYRVIYENGVILEYAMKDNRPVLVWAGDSLGAEFNQTIDESTGGMTVRYNDGRTNYYSQVAGFYEIQKTLSLRGEEETYCYYGQGMSGKCSEIKVNDLLGQIQTAIDALKNTGVDTGTAEFKVPELKANDPGLDYSIRKDGTVVFYAPREKTEWQETPNVLYSLGEFGHVTVYQYDASKKLSQTLEFRADRTLASVTEYDTDGRVSASYRYNPDGKKILSYSVYTYYATDTQAKDFRLLKTVETYSVGDLNFSILKELISQRAGKTLGSLESRVHYLPRHAEAKTYTKEEGKPNVTETALGRYDYLGLGLVDYTENFRRPVVTGGDPVFLSSVQQQYSVFQLAQSVTYKNLNGTAACGEGFSGCEITALDEFTYLPGTTDLDYTKRYWVSGNSLDNKVLQSVFRTEQVDEYTSVTHDFGKDYIEDSSDDTFTVQSSVPVGDDLDADPAHAEWGTEVIEYGGISDFSYTHKDGYKEAYRLSLFTDRQSHTFQYDVNGDGSVTRTKSFKFVRGVETPEISYTESQRRLGSEAGYEGTLAASLLGDLTGTALENFKGQEFTFSRSWKFGFDMPEADRIFRSESYSVTSRDEAITRTVSRDVVTDLLTYSNQRRIVTGHETAAETAVRGELLGTGALALTSTKDLFESWSYAGGFDTAQLLLDHSFSLDVYGDGTVTRTKNFKVDAGSETGEISYGETEDVARNTISYNGKDTIGELMLGADLGKDPNWAEEHVNRTQTWGVSFSVDSSARQARQVPPFEGESYQITSADGKITRSANWDAIKGEAFFNYVEQVKVPFDTTTTNGLRVGESLLGDVKDDKNWSLTSVLFMTSSRDAFNVANRFIDSESYQVTSRDRKETRTLAVNRYDPDGTRVSYSSSVRVNRDEIKTLMDDPKTTILPADREMFLSVFNDPEFAHNPFYLVTGSSDAFNVPLTEKRPRVVTSKAYQVTARDGDVTHSLMIDDRVPNGYPIATYQRQERMLKADIEKVLADTTITMVPPGTTMLDTGKTLAQTLQEALNANPYATFSMTTSNYYYPAGSTEARASSIGYSWSSRDGNSSYSLGINEMAPDGRPEMSFTQTQKVSHQAALDIAGQITDQAKQAEAFAAIRNDPMASISMAVTGLADPVYQWTSSKDPNLSFTLTANHSVPSGVTNTPTGTEVTFSRNTRVSRAEVVGKIALIPNEEFRAAELAKLAANPNCVYFSRQETITNDPDASYQWSALGDANTSFSLTLNSHVPVGIPNASVVYSKYTTEASLSTNTRVSKTVAAGYINADTNGQWIANPADQTAALTAYNAAAALGGSFMMVRTGSADPVLQWTVGSDPNTNYSLQIKDNVALGWHSALFSFNKRVSRDYVADQYKLLDAKDSRKIALGAAILSSDVFYMSMGDRGPTFQWTNTANRNISYSISLDEKFPAGSGYQVPPILTFATNTRVSVEEALADFAFIQDPARKQEAMSKLSAATQVYRSLSDGASSIDGKDAVYQFSDTASPDTSYTVSMRSGVPVGDPAAFTGREATFGISERVTQKEIEKWLNDQNIALIAQGTTAGESLKHVEVFYLSRGSEKEPGQYQWTSFTDPNVSFSLAVRQDLGQMTLAQATQVSAATVAAELAAAIAAGTITAGDSRKLAIQQAVADGLVFTSTAGDKGPNYQWSSETDKNKSYSLGVDTLVPVGAMAADGTYANHRTELSLTTSVRASIEAIKNQLGLIADDTNRAEALGRLSKKGTVVSRSVTDGVSATDGVDPVYQFGDPENPDINYSIALRGDLPVGTPDANGVYSSFRSEATWSISTRVSKAAVQAWLNKPGFQIINNGVALASALADTTLYYLSQAGTKDSGQYQWSNVSDPNTSFSLQSRDTFKQVTVNAVTQVSAETVRSELTAAVAAGTIALDDSRNKTIETAILNGKIFSRSTGDQGPSYQWLSETDKNRNYNLSVDKNFPVGLANANGQYTTFRTELSITTSDRVSAESVSAQAGMIKDPENLAEAKTKLALKGIAVTRSVTDGILATDGVEPVYQFVDPQDQDTNYSLTVRTLVPVGDPPTNTGAEATWGISRRVAPADALADLKKYETDPTRIAALEAALATGDAVYLSLAGSSDKNRQYQWTHRYDPNDPGASNVSYSLAVKDLHSEALFSVSTQVSLETVTAQIAILEQDFAAREAEINAEVAKASTTSEQKTALVEALATLTADRDAKRALIQAAITDGKLFTRQLTWEGEPSYSWSSNSNANVNYGLNLNTKVPVGLRDPVTQNYTQFRTEMSFTRSERTSVAVTLAEANRIEDPAKKAEAIASIAATDAAGGAFSSVSTDGKDPVNQWANPKNPDESWTLSVNKHVPNGTEANPLPLTTEMVFTHSVRVSKADVAAFVEKIADPAKKAEALAALETGKDFYLSQAGNDDPVYQWSNKDNSGISFTVTVNDHVPAGMPDASGNYAKFSSEVVFAHNERTSLQEMLALIPVIVDPVKQNEAYLSLFDAEIYSRSKAGNDDPSYQWTSLKDLNVSYSLARNTRLNTVSFSRTTRVSQAQVSLERGSLTVNFNTEKAALEAQIAALPAGAEKTALEASLVRLTSEYTSRLQRIDAALADAKGALFYMTQAGEDDPSYQWSSKANKNLNYTLSVNTKVPVGLAGADGQYASTRTELTFSRSERASVAEATSKLSLIRDTGDRTEAQAALAAQAATAGSAIYRSLTDTESVLDYDFANYSYQFTDVANPDKSYSITVNSYAPGAPEASWSIATRIGRDVVKTAAGFITENYNAARSDLQTLIAAASGDPAKATLLQQSLADLTANYQAKLADINKALLDGDSFVMSQAGSNDPTRQYQWTSKTNANISYSLNVKEDWHEATFNRTVRVSAEDVTKQFAYLKGTGDSRYTNLQMALIDSRVFTMAQAGNDDPSYQWSSETNRNLSYNVSLNSKIGVGIPNSAGVYPDTKTEVTLTRNERVALAEPQAQLSRSGMRITKQPQLQRLSNRESRFSGFWLTASPPWISRIPFTNFRT